MEKNKNKSGKGGVRVGSGRKKLADKKMQLPMYVLISDVELIGKETIRMICQKAIEIERENLIIEINNEF